jgi:VCBS repeat-containing protein
MVLMMLMTLMPNTAKAEGVYAEDEEYFVQSDSVSKFVSSYANGELWEMTPGGVSKRIGSTGKMWYDIENYEGKLYGVNQGILYENIDKNNRKKIADLGTHLINSLVERNGKFYYVDNSYELGHRLRYYDYKEQKIHTVINYLGYRSAGDLVFHDGELYLASSTNRLIKIDLSNHSKTEIMTLPPKTYGLSSLNGEIYALHDNKAEQLDLKGKRIKRTYRITNNGSIYGTGKGMIVVSGNVLDNDQSSKINLKDIAGTRFDNKNSLKLSSKYGTLIIHKDGHFDYYLKNDLKEIQNLGNGETIQDIFNYTTTFSGGKEDKANLIITIVGNSNNKNMVLRLDTFDINGNGTNDIQAGENINAKISQWIDSKGYNNVAVNPGGFSYSKNLINGHPGLDMSAKSVGYTIATHKDLNDQFFKQKSFAFVFKTGNNVTNTQVIYEQGGSAAGYNLVIDNANLYAMAYNTGKWSIPFQKIAMGRLNPNTLYIAYMVHDSNTGKFRAYLNKDLSNAVKVGELNNVDAQHTHTGGIGIGYVNGDTKSPVNNTTIHSTSSFNGCFGEIISWNYALSTDEINGLNTNLNIKWQGSDRLPPNSPTINATKTASQITFTLTDNGDCTSQNDGSYVSGIDKLQYKLADGNWTDYTDGSTITALSQPGEIIIYAKAIDKAGNTSQIVNQHVSNVDLPEVTMKVRDATGTKDTYEVTKQNFDKRTDKILNPSIVLKGKAFADINVKGKDVDFFEYQFINTSDAPQTLPTKDWHPINLNGEVINEDVVTEKQGYLNQRSYDVSDGIGSGAGVSISQANAQYWSDSKKVFKNPVQGTTYKAASYSTSTAAYGGWKNYLKPNGVLGRIWATNSIFIDRTKKLSFGNDYREASKFWGYIKVDQTGNYKFGAYSDDGSKGYITANGETKDFVNMFGLQGTRFGTTNNIYHLEAGKYYPIHLEYFNWGGKASFELHYSKNGLSWTRIPQNWFYPSKNLSPGEYDTTIFTGSKGVKFPSESGDYYIAFRTGKDGESTRKGLYGPFTINGKTPMSLSKSIVNIPQNRVPEKDTFQVEYTIIPSDMIPRSTFKNPNGTYKQQIFLENIKLQDEYPSSINIVSNSNNEIHQIEKNFPRIVYNLVTKNSKQVYSAQPISIRVSLSTKNVGTYTLSASGNSIISFTDLNGAKVQEEFDPITIDVIDITPPPVTISDPIMTDNKVNKTEESNITITGTTEANARVKIIIRDKDNKEVTREVTADNNSDYSVTRIDVSKSAGGLADGDLIIIATATDAAGNTSNPVEKIIVKDTTAPDVTIAGPVMGDNNIDGSEEKDITVKGTTEANVKVKILIKDKDNKEVEKEVIANSNGDYSVTGIDVSALAEGDLTIIAIATDAAGNISAPVTKTIRKLSFIQELTITDNSGKKKINIIPNASVRYKIEFKLNKDVDNLTINLGSSDNINLDQLQMTPIQLLKGNQTVSDVWQINEKSNGQVIFPNGLTAGEYRCYVKLIIKDQDIKPGNTYNININSTRYQNPASSKPDTYIPTETPSLIINVSNGPSIT